MVLHPREKKLGTFLRLELPVVPCTEQVFHCIRACSDAGRYPQGHIVRPIALFAMPPSASWLYLSHSSSPLPVLSLEASVLSRESRDKLGC